MTRRKDRTKPRAEPLLEFSDAEKHHGEVVAVGPVTFDVPAGQLVALVGHNGSGKSTLLATAAGVLTPTEGSITVSGVPAGEQKARAEISYIRDHPVLYQDLSVQEHLEFLTRLHGSTPEDHDADRIIDRLGLSHRVDDLPSTFSRGLRQKAAIAIALCRPFTVLLVDEPFSGLDSVGRDALMELIGEVQSRNGSVLVATHDKEALAIFDRVLMLREGELVYDGAPEHLPSTDHPEDR